MSARFAINVGLLTSPKTSLSGKQSVVSLGRIVAELSAAGYNSLTIHHHIATPEDAAVMVVTDENPLSIYSATERFNIVAEALQQDCIAVVPLEWTTGDTWAARWSRARLLGPRSESWGAFDRAQFIMPPGLLP